MIVESKLHFLRSPSRLRYYLPLLLPLTILIATGLRGLDFGLHWDERPWQIGPVKHMIESRTLLPGYYNYPSFDYWVNLAALSPDALSAIVSHANLPRHLIRVVNSHGFLLRLRAVYLVLGSLSLVWVYLLVLDRGSSSMEALLAASILGSSWEVAYHLRWIATDGMLMQFAALTALLSFHALKTERERWLIAAAVAGGLGFATKYPGGLLLVPVLLAALFVSTGSPFHQKMKRLGKIIAVFFSVFAVITPAVILRPAEVVEAVRYEAIHYATGHGGHTVAPGTQHLGEMVEYFATGLFSPYLIIAVLLFSLSVVGIVVLFVTHHRVGLIVFGFPILYLLYFSTQQVMIVRNLLVVAPFFALAAATGTCVIVEAFSRVRLRVPRMLLQAGWLGIIVGALCFDVFWLISSANSIAARHTDRFIREAAEYIRAHPGKIFLLSPRVAHDLRIHPGLLPNISRDWAGADEFVLYAREGMRNWRDWPANIYGLTERVFGPKEVNFDRYPNWYGDNRIVVISRDRARQIHLTIAGISTERFSASNLYSLPSGSGAGSATVIDQGLDRDSWVVPRVEPCSLITRTEAAAVLGSIKRGPLNGGWQFDGSACTFLGRNETIVSVAIVSTSALNLERYDSVTHSVPALGVNAYTISKKGGDDLRLFARGRRSAVIVHVTSGSNEAGRIAREFAEIMLRKLDRANPQDRENAQH